MDGLVLLFTVVVTLGILNSIKIDKTPNQLMLLGIEITIIGAVLTIIAVSSTSGPILFVVSIVLIVIGLIVNLFGFSKK